VVEMSMETLLNWRTIIIALISLCVTFYCKKVNTAFIVVGGALLGYLLSLITL
jgi:chromate transporter